MNSYEASVRKPLKEFIFEKLKGWKS